MKLLRNASLLPILAVAACVPAAAGAVQGAEPSPAQAAYDVLHYDLEIEVDPDREAIEGTLTVRARVLRPMTDLVLDLDRRLEVRGAASGKRVLSHVQREGRVSIDLEPLGGLARGDEVQVSVRYGGKPRVAPRPPWDGGFTWTTTPSGEPWIATSCQGEGADLWWPCKDHPSDEPESMDIAVTVPEGLVVATNGKRTSVEVADGKVTSRWHVSTPINNYGVALNIAPYVELEREYRSVTGEVVPVTFWVLPEHREKGEAILPEFLEHLRFFEELLGAYPFRADKYGIAETPHLGMEHQTIIAYGNEFKEDTRWEFDWLHHHELAHEWWGNLATAADWRDFWIHESFATYAQALYAEQLHGAQGYRGYMRRFWQFNNKKPVAPRQSRSAGDAYFTSAKTSADNDVYYKGAWVLHTLRWLLGDEAFFRAQRRLAYPDPELAATSDGSACHFVTTEDFIALAEEEHGAELDWFFEVYLRQPRLPDLVTREERGVLHLSWSVPDDLTFPMPVEVRRGDELVRVPVPPAGATLDVTDADVDVEIDPNRWLLRK